MGDTPGDRLLGHDAKTLEFSPLGKLDGRLLWPAGEDIFYFIWHFFRDPSSSLPYGLTAVSCMRVQLGFQVFLFDVLVCKMHFYYVCFSAVICFGSPGEGRKVGLSILEIK